MYNHWIVTATTLLEYESHNLTGHQCTIFMNIATDSPLTGVYSRPRHDQRIRIMKGQNVTSIIKRTNRMVASWLTSISAMVLRVLRILRCGSIDTNATYQPCTPYHCQHSHHGHVTSGGFIHRAITCDLLRCPQHRTMFQRRKPFTLREHQVQNGFIITQCKRLRELVTTVHFLNRWVSQGRGNKVTSLIATSCWVGGNRALETTTYGIYHRRS